MSTGTEMEFPVGTRWAEVEIPHPGLSLDAAGRLAEIPALLDAVEVLRVRLSGLMGTQFEVDKQPFSSIGRYFFRVQDAAESRHLDVAAASELFHGKVDQLDQAWKKIEANAGLPEPRRWCEIGVSGKELACLKAVGRVRELKVSISRSVPVIDSRRPSTCVEAEMKTPDGRISIFPPVDLELLANAAPPEPDELWVDHLVTGLEFLPDDSLRLRLEYDRWIRAPRLSRKAAGSVHSGKTRLKGKLTYSEGMYEYHGEELCPEHIRDIFECAAG